MGRTPEATEVQAEAQEDGQAQAGEAMKLTEAEQIHQLEDFLNDVLQILEDIELSNFPSWQFACVRERLVEQRQTR